VRPSDRAWLALGVGVLTYDVACRDGEMLSQASARYAREHPVAAYAVVAAVALHLVDRIPAAVDPIHWVGIGLRGLRHGLRSAAA
jgi:hypothetical protein